MTKEQPQDWAKDFDEKFPPKNPDDIGKDDRFKHFIRSTIESVRKEEYERGLKEGMRQEWVRFIDYLERNMQVASIAKDLLWHSELEKSLENSKNWYKGMFGHIPPTEQ